MYDDYDGRTALLATHIDPGWSAVDAFGEAVDRYIEAGGYDDLVYVSSPEPSYSVGGYEDVADTVFSSMGGSLGDRHVDELLDSYDRFVHIGAYWGLCHRQSFESLLPGIAERDAEYRIDIPLDAVTTGDTIVEDDVLAVPGPVDTESQVFRVYQEAVEELFDAGQVDTEIGRDPALRLSYTFKRGL